MKKLFAFLPLIVLFSCGSINSKPFVPKTDSIDVLVRTIKGGPTYTLLGIYTINRRFAPEDSGSSKGKWTIDTSWIVKVASDTLKDSAKHPLFDSLHHPFFRYTYQPIDPKYLQIITVPHK